MCLLSMEHCQIDQALPKYLSDRFCEQMCLYYGTIHVQLSQWRLCITWIIVGNITTVKSSTTLSGNCFLVIHISNEWWLHGSTSVESGAHERSVQLRVVEFHITMTIFGRAALLTEAMHVCMPGLHACSWYSASVHMASHKHGKNHLTPEFDNRSFTHPTGVRLSFAASSGSCTPWGALVQKSSQWRIRKPPCRRY